MTPTRLSGYGSSRYVSNLWRLIDQHLYHKAIQHQENDEAASKSIHLYGYSNNIDSNSNKRKRKKQQEGERSGVAER